MDQSLLCLGIIVFGGIAVLYWFNQYMNGGSYEGDDAPYDTSYEEDDSSSWSSSSRRRSSSFGGSLFRSNSSSSRSSSSSGRSSFSAGSRRSARGYNSSKIQSCGGFGRNKK